MLRKDYERQKELQMMSLLASFQCVSEEQPNDDPNPKPQGEVLPQPSGVEGLSIGKKRTRDDSDDPGSARKRKPSKLNPASAHPFALSSKRLVCEESIPALIRFIHGSTCSKLKTVKKFQLYLARIIPEKNGNILKVYIMGDWELISKSIFCINFNSSMPNPRFGQVWRNSGVGQMY